MNMYKKILSHNIEEKKLLEIQTLQSLVRLAIINDDDREYLRHLLNALESAHISFESTFTSRDNYDSTHLAKIEQKGNRK